MTDASPTFAEQLFDALLRLTSDPPGVTRASFGTGEAAAHRLAADAAGDLGLAVARDLAGNLMMTWQGTDRSLPRLFVGSHMDSVRHGGNFDGAAGVVMGLDAVRALQADGFRPRRDVVVMAIRAEELVWFPTPYCGSRMAFGRLPAADYDDVRRSDTGRSLADHMAEAGADPAALKAGARPLDPATIHAFIEPHIEQGPVLEALAVPVGLVTGIRGNLRYRHGRITGRTDHAGAVPRDHRRDAVLAGGALLAAIEAHWDRMEAAGTDFVATVGEFWTDPAQHGMTKVPGDVRFTLDIRSLDSDVLFSADRALRQAAAEIGAARGVTLDLGPSTHAPPAAMDTDLVAALHDLAAEADIPVHGMASGAGHDCASFAAEGIRSAMIFVRNQNGSHNPDEAMRMADFDAASRLLAAFIRREAE